MVMKTLRVCAVALCASVLLSGCMAHMQEEESVTVFEPVAYDMDMYDMQQMMGRPLGADGVHGSYSPHQYGRLDKDERVASYEQAPVYADTSVEIFSPWSVVKPEAKAGVYDINAELAPIRLRPPASMADQSVMLEKPMPVRDLSAQVYKPVMEKNTDDSVRIYFGHGARQVDQQSQKTLSELSEAVRRSGHPIKVTGYASERAGIENPTDRKIANLKTSLDRAFEVSKTLIKDGVPAEVIETSAWGETRPAAPVEGMTSEKASRRVEITPRLAQ